MHIIRAAALELPHVGLADALAVCMIIREQEPARYEAAAVRWLARYALEAPGADLAGLHKAAEAFCAADEATIVELLR